MSGPLVPGVKPRNIWLLVREMAEPVRHRLEQLVRLAVMLPGASVLASHPRLRASYHPKGAWL